MFGRNRVVVLRTVVKVSIDFKKDDFILIFQRIFRHRFEQNGRHFVRKSRFWTRNSDISSECRSCITNKLLLSGRVIYYRHVWPMLLKNFVVRELTCRSAQIFKGKNCHFEPNSSSYWTLFWTKWPGIHEKLPIFKDFSKYLPEFITFYNFSAQIWTLVHVARYFSLILSQLQGRSPRLIKKTRNLGEKREKAARRGRRTRKNEEKAWRTGRKAPGKPQV